MGKGDRAGGALSGGILVTVRGVVARLAALLRSKRMDRELDDEVLAHLELAERDGIARGLSREEARLAARREFGGIAQLREEHRDQRSFNWLANLAHDFGHGLSLLIRDPGFAVIAIGILALGIGANVAMFGILDSALLKPLPFPHPERIMRIWEAPRPGTSNSTSSMDFLDWKRMAKSFEALAAEDSSTLTLTGKGEPVRLSGKIVTGDFFRVFPVNPLLGRTFAAEEDRRGAEPVVVISHGTWQKHFDGDPNILNRHVTLDGESHQIIGVLPPGATADRDRSEFWKLLVFTPEQLLRGFHWLVVHGRTRVDVSPSQAWEEMKAVRVAMLPDIPIFKRDWTIVVQPLEQLVIGRNLRQSILVAFGAVLLVLLIACANVANLLLAKGAVRTKEIAIRAALGASRGRLFAQLATESLALCLLGGGAGLALAAIVIKTAGPFISQSLPFSAPLQLDFRLFGFAAMIALGVAVLVGAMPSLQSSAGSLELSLRQAGRGSSAGSTGLRRYIVIGEIALSLVLVCGAFLLFKSLLNLQRIETGVRIENVITMSVDLPAKTYPAAIQASGFYEAVIERVKGIPGIRQAAFSTHVPLRWIGNGEYLELSGGKEPINVRFKRVDPGYFATFGIPVLSGRGLVVSDRNGAKRVVVINEALAKRIQDGAGIQNPVGQLAHLHCPLYGSRGGTDETVEIAGIIRSERVADPGVPDPAVLYVPLAQVPSQGVTLIVRTHSDPASVVSGIREVIRSIDPALPLGEITTMQEVRERTLSGATRPAWVIGAFASIAALLTAVGLYGVLSQMVSQRRREIGIRMALGARAGDVVRDMMRNGLALVLMGLGIGLAGAYALTRVMKNLLFEVSPLDPAALAIACLSMILIGLLAGFVPASRAAHVDPVTTLRDE